MAGDGGHLPALSLLDHEANLGIWAGFDASVGLAGDQLRQGKLLVRSAGKQLAELPQEGWIV